MLAPAMLLRAQSVGANGRQSFGFDLGLPTTLFFGGHKSTKLRLSRPLRFVLERVRQYEMIVSFAIVRMVTMLVVFVVAMRVTVVGMQCSRRSRIQIDAKM